MHSRNPGNGVVRRLPTVPDEAGQPSQRLVLFNKFRQLLMRKPEAVRVENAGKHSMTVNRFLGFNVKPDKARQLPTERLRRSV